LLKDRTSVNLESFPEMTQRLRKPRLALAVSGFVLVCTLPCSALTVPAADSSAALGGALTHFESNRDAFAQPAPSLDSSQFRVFNFGNRLFNTNWVIAPASVEVFDGLGPTFNRASCSGCHLRDGRGRPPVEGERALLSMLIRWSVPGAGRDGEPREVPGYGTQLNDRAVPGVNPEAQVDLRWTESSSAYADGTRYALRSPVISFRRPAYGRFPSRLLTSARVAPAVIGMGLLEAVSESDVLSNADPHDRDGDGISGRPNRVHDPLGGGQALGRFGWKAGVPSLKVQSASAASGDMGLTTSLFPYENCPDRQQACRRQVSGGSPELGDVNLDKLVQYLRFLGVPARRNLHDPLVRMGEVRFREFGCAACHLPSLRTAADAQPSLLADQTIRPYTDLLLHDMGEGLADHRPEFLATGREWRTAPLWGVGLIPMVNGHQFLLHDGRARGVAEAILWHGGEGRRARNAFIHAVERERDELMAFVNSL
jgi:CxxC motif-containing protein (DUF1111 family)